jgi:hypothetical protein
VTLNKLNKNSYKEILTTLLKSTKGTSITKLTKVLKKVLYNKVYICIKDLVLTI